MLLVYATYAFSDTSNHAWETLEPGIEYLNTSDAPMPWSHLHVFRIQLSKHPLSLVSAKSLGLKQALVAELGSEVDAKLAINGGFFDANFEPLGLRIQKHAQLNPKKSISWWGVFFMEGDVPHIQSNALFQNNDRISFAIQSGPRLLIDGAIPHLRPGEDERTALGITKSGELIIVVTENHPLTTTALAEIMRREPILAFNALNLDGGSSSQLYVNTPALHLDIHGFAMVADAVVVK